MRLTILLLSATLAAQTSAQQGLYLRPQVAKKWSSNANEHVGFTTAQGYDFIADPEDHLAPIGLYFGIAIGYRKSPWMVELSIAEDVVEYGVGVNATRWTSVSGAGYTQIRHIRTGELYSRAGLIAGYCILGPKGNHGKAASHLEVWGALGLERWHRRFGVTSGSERSEWAVSPVHTASWQFEEEIIRSSAYAFTPRVLIKAFNRKGHSLLNLAVTCNFLLGEQKLIAAHNHFTNSADGATYTSTIYGRGNGLYAAISKDIYFNNIFRRRRERLARE